MMPPTLRCAICDYAPDKMGQVAAERDLRKHIQTHSRANLWELAYEQSGIGSAEQSSTGTEHSEGSR